MDNFDDDDLYADMDLVKPSPTQQSTGFGADDIIPSGNKNKGASSRMMAHRPLSLTEEVQALRERVSLLERENGILRRNIGTLYRTAVAEIHRKDGVISTLQETINASLTPSHKDGPDGIR